MAYQYPLHYNAIFNQVIQECVPSSGIQAFKIFKSHIAKLH